MAAQHWKHHDLHSSIWAPTNPCSKVSQASKLTVDSKVNVVQHPTLAEKCCCNNHAISPIKFPRNKTQQYYVATGPCLANSHLHHLLPCTSSQNQLTYHSNSIFRACVSQFNWTLALWYKRKQSLLGREGWGKNHKGKDRGLTLQDHIQPTTYCATWLYFALLKNTEITWNSWFCMRWNSSY